MLRSSVVGALMLMASVAFANDKGPVEKGPLVASPKHHRVVMTIITYQRRTGHSGQQGGKRGR